ncbi:MAG: PAS domain-containing protein [candidate division KSB1 bacterium]|nr:PAS domain-containing protein [candidate division KSB1 bacterium]
MESVNRGSKRPRWMRQAGSSEREVQGEAGKHVPVRLCVLLILSVAANGTAHVIPKGFSHLGVAEGLSQSMVYCIAQDSMGFVWFGTEDGLNRYDGYAVRVFRSDPRKSGYARANPLINIYALSADRRGGLWIGSYGGGLSYYDPAADTIRTLTHSPGDSAGLSSNNVGGLWVDRDGFVWIATLGGGLSRLDPATGSFVHYRADALDPHALSSDYVRCVYEDDAGRLWVGTEGYGLCLLERGTGLFTRYRHDARNPKSLVDDYVRGICGSRRGTLWLATDGGLEEFDPEEGVFVHHLGRTRPSRDIPTERLWTVHEDDQGTVWYGTRGGGLVRYDPATGHALRYAPDPKDPASLRSDIIWSLLQDRNGVLWVGTMNGVSTFKGHLSKFALYRHDPDNPSSLCDNSVRAFLEDRFGDLWVGTDNGLSRMRRRGTGQVEFQSYFLDMTPFSATTGRRVFALAEDSLGHVWVGTYGGGLVRITRSTGSMRRYRANPSDPTALPGDYIRALYCDRRGVLWVGTTDGLARLEPGGTGFRRFRAAEGDSASLSSNWVSAICEADSVSLWVGTREGLNLFDRRTGRCRRYLHREDDPQSLSTDYVISLYPDAQGTLWVGTLGGGLNRLDPGTGKCVVYTERDGLANNVVYGILADRRGRLWLSTNNGLSVFDPAPGTFRNYDIADGLQSNEFNAGAYLAGRDGTMYFGGVEGFNAFVPERIQNDPTPPVVLLTGFSLFNQPVPVGRPYNGRVVLDRPIGQTSFLHLHHTDRVITFEYTGLHFVCPLRITYAYKMEGFDPDWNYVGSRRHATYTNLPPGKYQFKVKAANMDGVWSQPRVVVAVEVMPPLWDTWWFKTGAVVVFALLGFAAVQWRTRAVIRRNAELEARVEQRTAELRKANAELNAEVSERRRAEVALRESEDHLRTLVDSTVAGIITIDAKTHKVVGVNRAAAGLIGLPEEQILGKPCHQFLCPTEPGQCPVTDLGRELDYAESTLLTAHGEALPIIKTVVTVRRRGKTLLVESFLNVATLKQVEQALRAEREQLISVMDSISEPIYVVDMDTYEILFANRALQRAFNRALVGGICYRNFQGYDAPCSFCTNDRIRQLNGEPYEWDYHNPVLDRDFHLVDRVIRWPDGRSVRFEMAIDVTERNRAMEKLTASLKEKEVLLKEIHHRVKNNMQVISSMLRLQAGYIQDPQALELFQESQNRVKSMALIHEKLYQSQDLARIDFADYLRNLTSHLFRSYSGRPDVTLNVEVGDVHLSVETGIPCGLIVNELVSNALKHAFPGGRSGQITVSLQRNNGTYVLSVKDDGVGFPKDVDFRNTPSLGLQLVNTLTTQLEGSVELISNGVGTEFRIQFPAEERG